jgi:hypothetical protein
MTMRRILLFAPLLLQAPLFAQSCDSLNIISVQYAPFGGGIHVEFHNGSTQFMSAPMFDAFNAEGDTLVLGSFNFFGMGPGTTQLHQLPLVSGAPTPVSPFTGTLVLHHQEVDSVGTCIFPLTEVDLCPPDTCIPLLVYAYEQGTQAETDLDWSVTDAENILQAEGELHIDTGGFGYSVTDLCLFPGEYTLHLEQAIPAGNIIQVGMTQAGFAYTDGTGTQLPIGGSVDHPFSFYGPCAEGTQEITPHGPGAMLVVLDGRKLLVSSGDGSALGQLLLLDGMGRIVRSINATASRTSFDLGAMASGTYFLRSMATDKGWGTHRFILL